MEPALLKTFVTELLEKLGYGESTIEVKTGHRTVAAVSSADSAHLVGPGGEHLRALNTVARRLVEQKHGEEAASFLIDVNGHHEAQLDKVRSEANKLAQRVKLFKHDVEMPVMSSYERLVVHELFADDPEIKTESMGEGKFRHIVLKYKDKALAI